MNINKETVTSSEKETENCGALLAKNLAEDNTLPRFIAMYGDLGVGKTTFIRGFAKIFSPAGTVRSPTFTLVNSYRCTGEYSHVSKFIYHFDMYRIQSEDDLYSIGYYDYLDSGCICIAEWCELIEYALPQNYIKVEILKISGDPDKRIIKVNYINDK